MIVFNCQPRLVGIQQTMCCKEYRELFKKKSKSLRCHNKKSSKGKKAVAGLVPKGSSTRTTVRKRVAVCKPHENANGAALVMHSPDHSRRRILKQKRAFIDCSVNHQPPAEEENLEQTNLDAIPLDVLVQIICKLKDDDVDPLFHVSKKFREAVLLARRIHFAFITPTRSSARSRFNLMNSDTDCGFGRSLPPCPKAPRPPRVKSRMSLLSAEIMAKIAAAFEDDEADSVRVPVRAAYSNRIRSCEDELCEAVARYTL